MEKKRFPQPVVTRLQSLQQRTVQEGGQRFMVVNFTSLRDFRFLLDTCEKMRKWLVTTPPSGNALVLLTQQGRGKEDRQAGEALWGGVSDPLALVASCYLLWADPRIDDGKHALLELQRMGIEPAAQYKASADRYAMYFGQLFQLNQFPCCIRLQIARVKVFGMPRWAYRGV
eukprot:gene54220-41826_t